MKTKQKTATVVNTSEDDTFSKLQKIAKQISYFIYHSDKISYLHPTFQKKGWM